VFAVLSLLFAGGAIDQSHGNLPPIMVHGECVMRVSQVYFRLTRIEIDAIKSETRNMKQNTKLENTKHQNNPINHQPQDAALISMCATV